MDKQFFESHGVVQVEGESAKAFLAFRQYLQMPPERRSLRKLVQDGYKFGTLSKWSSQFGWQERAVEFDASVSSAGLDQLLGARVSLVVQAVQGSLEDADVLRDEVMRHVPGASVEKLASLVNSRAAVEAWRLEIVGVLNQIGERNAQA